jgi:acyl carrier protein
MTPNETKERVLELLRQRFPVNVSEIPDDQPLGPEGVGLDSIAVAEFLLDCERDLGIDAIALLDGRPITLRAISESIRSGRH